MLFLGNGFSFFDFGTGNPLLLPLHGGKDEGQQLFCLVRISNAFTFSAVFHEYSNCAHCAEKEDFKESRRNLEQIVKNEQQKAN